MNDWIISIDLYGQNKKSLLKARSFENSITFNSVRILVGNICSLPGHCEEGTELTSGSYIAWHPQWRSSSLAQRRSR